MWTYYVNIFSLSLYAFPNMGMQCVLVSRETPTWLTCNCVNFLISNCNSSNHTRVRINFLFYTVRFMHETTALYMEQCTTPSSCQLLATTQYQQVWYFISKNQPGLRCYDPLKSSPGSHSLLVSDSVGITSRCSLLAILLSVSLTSQYPPRTCNCARLLIVTK